jgi:hypothetical protein
MLRRCLLLLAVAAAALGAPSASAGADPDLGPARSVVAASQALAAGDDVADPGAGSTTSTTDPPTSTSRELPGTTLEAANEGDGGSAAPWLIGAGIAAAVAIAAGGYLLKRRMG